ncbi:MAG: conserved phage C-terminal domain-containing protein [Deltaproteobacteria bacterium]|nr:conserved phage C-terminal domain-containing protein [Deltaproteobacteria bacterium]
MSRLLIPNTCQVPNVLLDEVIPKLRSAPVRVLLAIIRLTYGWGKTSDQISLSQLAKKTGLTRRAVIKGIRALGDLVIIRHGAKGKGVNQYSLNINISTGSLLSNSWGSSEQPFPSEQPDTSEQKCTRVVNQRSPFQTHISKPSRSRSKAADVFFPIIEGIVRRLNELSGKSYRPGSKTIVKNLLARLKDGASEEDCLAVVEDRWQRWGNDPKMAEHFNPVTLFRPANFEKYLTEAKTDSAGNQDQDPEWRKRTFVNA